MNSKASVKCLLLQAGLLLLVNVVVIVCGAAVDVFWNWMDNPTAAAFPALMTFLLSFWQPWVLLGLVAYPYAIIAAPFISVPVTMLMYQTLFRLGKLNWVYGLWFRFSPRQKAIAAVSFLMLGTLSSYAGYKDIPVQHRGVPDIVAKRDAHLVTTYALSDSRYYTQDKFLCAYHLWRVRVPQANVAPLAEVLNLKRIPKQKLPADFWQQEPIWWQRPAGNSWEAYGNPLCLDTLVKGFGVQIECAAYDTQTQTFYYWFQANME